MAVAEEIVRLRDSKQAALGPEADCLSKRQKMEEMTEFLYGQTGMIRKYEKGLIKSLVGRDRV